MCRCAGLCTYPHGPLSVYALILAISSYLFTISATWGCYFVRIDVTLMITPPYVSSSTGGSGIGLFSFEDKTVHSNSWICTDYTPDMMNTLFDAGYSAAMAFAIISNTLIGLSLLFLMISSCVQFSVPAIKGVGCMLIAGSFSMWFTYVAYASERICGQYNCRFYIGSGLVIAAALLSLITGMVVFMLPPADPFGGESPSVSQPAAFSPGTETITETVLPDGTKKITKTVVNADGSQTVTETVENPN